MLKHTYLLAAAVAAAAVALPSSAQSWQQTSPQPTITDSTEVITVRPTRELRRYYMTRDDVHEVSGEYAMEDGSTARITDRQRKLYVDFDNRRTELQAVGANVFQSAADDMTLVYTKDGLGDDMIVLSYIPQRQVAGLPPQRVQLSSR